jgi:hypothetical protein
MLTAIPTNLGPQEITALLARCKAFYPESFNSHAPISEVNFSHWYNRCLQPSVSEDVAVYNVAADNGAAEVYVFALGDDLIAAFDV